MPKKKRRKGHQRRPQQRHLTSVQPGPAVSETPEHLSLFQGLRQALRSDQPLDLLGAVSSLMAATLPHDPFAEAPVSLAELVETFIGTPYAETTAALTIIQALTEDDLLAGRIGRELTRRRHPMPHWLTGLATPARTSRRGVSATCCATAKTT
ncbi:hypothetical protein [Sanguibacter sp. Z1732]|uniref:hypothetical protein n=1 Tax=Sanguibacter sp. Z1732 TaxID=3435412 RepID=UPI003D9C86A7